jgi:hypothetical protein
VGTYACPLDDGVDVRCSKGVEFQKGIAKGLRAQGAGLFKGSIHKLGHSVRGKVLSRVVGGDLGFSKIGHVR